MNSPRLRTAYSPLFAWEDCTFVNQFVTRSGVGHPDNFFLEGACARNQRQHSRRALPVREASESEGNLNSRVWILQKLDVVQRTGSFAQLQLNVRTRNNVAVSLANVFKRGTFEPRSHRDRRRGRRNEIDQQQRDCAYCKRGRGRCFEDLPATESQHSHFPEPQSAVMKANSLCHRGVRATNGHLITRREAQ